MVDSVQTSLSGGTSGSDLSFGGTLGGGGGGNRIATVFNRPGSRGSHNIIATLVTPLVISIFSAVIIRKLVKN